MENEPRSPEKAEFSSPELEAKPELRGPERSHESEADQQRNVEKARKHVEKLTSHEKGEKHKESGPKERHASGIDRKASYKETMRSIQRHLPATSRAFSKVIHNNAVDKTSEVLGKTVLRPSVTLGATSTALIVAGIAYILAKRYGYSLSGSAILFSLLVGGIVGLLFEGISKLFRRKN